MKRYYIEEAKCGLTSGGFACGPVPANVVVTVRFNDGTGTKWISAVECTGIPNYFLLDRDMHDELIEEKDETIEYVQQYYICDLNGIALDSEYVETCNSIRNDPDNPAVPFVRYIIALLRCSMDEIDGLIEMAAGKYADELDIPVSDVEEDDDDDDDEDDDE